MLIGKPVFTDVEGNNWCPDAFKNGLFRENGDGSALTLSGN
jgi:hypothetical protein